MALVTIAAGRLIAVSALAVAETDVDESIRRAADAHVASDKLTVTSELAARVEELERAPQPAADESNESTGEGDSESEESSADEGVSAETP